jgi:hypothetical protein
MVIPIAPERPRLDSRDLPPRYPTPQLADLPMINTRRMTDELTTKQEDLPTHRETKVSEGHI